MHLRMTSVVVGLLGLGWGCTAPTSSEAGDLAGGGKGDALENGSGSDALSHFDPQTHVTAESRTTFDGSSVVATSSRSELYEVTTQAFRVSGEELVSFTLQAQEPGWWFGDGDGGERAFRLRVGVEGDSSLMTEIRPPTGAWTHVRTEEGHFVGDFTTGTGETVEHRVPVPEHLEHVLQPPARDVHLKVEVWPFAWPRPEHEVGQGLETEVVLEVDCTPVKPQTCMPRSVRVSEFCGAVWECPRTCDVEGWAPCGENNQLCCAREDMPR